MSKDNLLIDALKASNIARKILIDKLLEDGLNKDKQIHVLKWQIALLKRSISSKGFFPID